MLTIRIYTLTKRSSRYSILKAEVESLLSSCPKAWCAIIESISGFRAIWAWISHGNTRLPFVTLNNIVVSTKDIASFHTAFNRWCANASCDVDNNTNRKTIAILGASSKEYVYSHKAVEEYINAGYDVYPVNVHGDSVCGLKVYRSINEIPVHLNMISIYLPPGVVRTILDDIEDKKPEVIYFNPGSYNENIIKETKKRGLPLVCSCSIKALHRG